MTSLEDDSILTVGFVGAGGNGKTALVEVLLSGDTSPQSKNRKKHTFEEEHTAAGRQTYGIDMHDIRIDSIHSKKARAKLEELSAEKSRARRTLARKDVQLEDRQAHFRIDDTSGQKELEPLTVQSLQSHDVTCIVVDCKMANWKHHLDYWLGLAERTRRLVPEPSHGRRTKLPPRRIVIAFSKSDLIAKYGVMKKRVEDAEAYVKAKGLPCVRVSAKKRRNLDELVEILLDNTTVPTVERTAKCCALM